MNQRGTPKGRRSSGRSSGGSTGGGFRTAKPGRPSSRQGGSADSEVRSEGFSGSRDARPGTRSRTGAARGDRRSAPTGRRGRGNPGFGSPGRETNGRNSGTRERRRDMEEVTPAAEEFIIGRRAVAEALKGERAMNKILVQEGASGGSLGEILAVARERGVVVQNVPKAKLDETAKNSSHQGVLAYISAKPYLELDELIAHARQKKPGLLVILDGVEDPHNLGSILRSADGAGAAGVIIPKRRAAPLTGTVSKASAGALEHVAVARVTNVNQAIETLQEAGFWVIGTDLAADKNHWDVDFTGPTVLVIGGEGEGISRLTKQKCDLLVRIPMKGEVGSLNAGVAAGVLLYEVIRQRAQGAVPR